MSSEQIKVFVAQAFAKLFEVKNELLQKYPDRSERIEFICKLLTVKLNNLGDSLNIHMLLHTLYDYVSTLYHATKEFRELEELAPKPEVIESLLGLE